MGPIDFEPRAGSASLAGEVDRARDKPPPTPGTQLRGQLKGKPYGEQLAMLSPGSGPSETAPRSPAKKTGFGAFDPKGQLSTVHPLLRAKVKVLEQNAHAAGLDVFIIEGYRSFETQNKLYAKGRTAPGSIVTKAKGGGSWHNFGIAVDVVFHGRSPYGEEHDWKALGKAGEAAGLEWGGNWKGMLDRPHFQIPEMKLAHLQAWYREGGLPNVWKNLGGTVQAKEGGAEEAEAAPHEENTDKSKATL